MFPFTDKIRPICLPFQDPIRNMDLGNYNPFIAGWGATSFRGQPSEVLREAQITILPKEICEQNYRAAFQSQIIADKVSGSSHDEL